MSIARTSLLFSFAEKYVLLLLAIVGTMVLARLLTPREIGVYSVGAVVLGVAQVVRDFGVGQYLVAERELTRDKLSAVLATSLLFAWSLGALIVVLSEPLAHFYQEPRLVSVLRVLALNFVLLPCTAVILPVLRRQLRFGAICTINLANGATSFIVSVWLVWRGVGFMSLAWASVAAGLATLLTSLWFRPADSPWWPRTAGMRRVLAFGGWSTGGTLIDEAGVAAPDLIIGKLIGMDGVGLFGKAAGMLAIFNQAITSAVSPVVFPLWSQKAREDADLCQAYLMTVSYMTALAWPFFLFVAVMATPLVSVLYGAQWSGAVPLVRVMCLGTALYSMFSMARYLLVAIGKVNIQARLDTQAVAFRIPALLLAAPFGLMPVAWAVMLGALFRSWLTYRYLARFNGLTLSKLGRAVTRSAGMTAASAIAPVALLLALEPAKANGVAALGCAALGSGVLWLAAAVLLKHELAADIARVRRTVFALSGLSNPK